ncbi:MAG: tRNA uridine-5-carboxymethylaminomethyl(34) synthesis enzyme MnmG, partial [Sphingomicrobium sp.]
NAAAEACDLAPVRFDRSSSYIGVMIDDLTLHGVTEPYRMMTARAEFRLHLRADNASTRLGSVAIAANCVGAQRKASIEARAVDCEGAWHALDLSVAEGDLIEGGSSERKPLREWLLRPATRAGAAELVGPIPGAEEAIADADYAPYLERQKREWASVLRDTQVRLPASFDFRSVPGMSTEMIERLAASRPETLGHAARVRGVTPAALSALHFALARAG